MDNPETALLIIDMQNDFVLSGSPCCVAGALATIPNIVQVLNKFRANDYPVFHIVREYRDDGSDVEKFRYKEFVEGKKCAVPNTPGCEIIKELMPLDSEYRLVKNRFSGFMNTELDFMLKRLSISEIVITGTQYPNCIRTTVFDAIALGYDVTVVTDAASAATEEIARANITDLKNVGVNCVLASEI